MTRFPWAPLDHFEDFVDRKSKEKCKSNIYIFTNVHYIYIYIYTYKYYISYVVVYGICMLYNHICWIYLRYVCCMYLNVCTVVGFTAVYQSCFQSVQHGVFQKFGLCWRLMAAQVVSFLLLTPRESTAAPLCARDRQICLAE